MSNLEGLKRKFKALGFYVDEKLRRVWTTTEALALGRGGIAAVSSATGLSPKIIRFGIYELEENSASQPQPTLKSSRIRSSGGGSNGYRLRLWKTELQKLANETELQKLANETEFKITLAHFPPGTSKWNKIEHRMFCHITENWRGRPLTSREVVVNLIGSTTTQKGLTVKASLDENKYEKGRKISDKKLLEVNLEKAEFHGEWNYAISPQPGANR